MKNLDKFKIAVPKRVLFFAAALVWGFASSRILEIAIKDMINIKNNWIYIIIGIIGFYFFFKGVFYRLYKKHTTRIVNSKKEKMCVFSFFDAKGYVIMAFMISMGIFIRKLNVVPTVYLSTFYISLGLSLLGAGISFLYAGIEYKNIIKKYMIS